MKTKVVLDPMTRLEGHLRVEAVVEDGAVVEAHVGGTLYRGFEQILKGREPMDAVQISQRFCGVCPIGHSLASSQCLENAMGIMPPDNGRIIRNLIQGANYLQSHILHFYHLAALDFVPGPEVPPFIPRQEGDYRLPKAKSDEIVGHYLQALQVRLKSHELAAVFSGKMPHSAAAVAGGVTVQPTTEKVAVFLSRLKEVRAFINDVYLPDVLAIADVYRDEAESGAGCKRLLSYGAFDLDLEPDVTRRKRFFQMGRLGNGRLESVDPASITEDLSSSWYRRPASPQAPASGDTEPDPKAASGYSWVRAPRYDDTVYEVGPLARLMIARASGRDSSAARALDAALAHLRLKPDNLFSVMGRHLCRAVEAKVLADAMADWVLQIKAGEPVVTPHSLPEEASGFGLTDAPRGALGHWISIRNKVIERYQAVVPTTWNASPRDRRGQPGPMEQALVGARVKEPANPFSIARIVRSFDPCMACAIHLVTPRGELLRKIAAV